MCGKKFRVLKSRRPVHRFIGSLARKRARLISGKPPARGLQAACMSVLRHELRTPLTGILGMSELLQNSGLSGEQEGLVSALQESGRQMERLIQKTALPLSAPGHGIPTRSGPVNGLQLLEQVTRAHWPAALKKGIGLHLVFDHRLTDCWHSDARCLRQLLDNLLANAIKFTDRGYVLVHAQPAGLDQHGTQDIEFRVSDTGIGITARDDQRIYRARERGSGDVHRRHGGSGLGLYVCKRIAASLGGSIGHQPNPGGGTCFRVMLPGLAEASPGRARRFRPALLTGLRCELGLAGPGHQVVTQLLRRIGVQIGYLQTDRIHRLSGGCIAVICDSGRMGDSISKRRPVFKEGTVVLLSHYLQSSTRGREEGHKARFLELPQPILQSNLEPLLLQLALQRAVNAPPR